MARYFIDLRDIEGTIRDDEGAEYPHLEDALNEAKQSARDVIQHHLDSRMPLGVTCVEVRDSEDRVVAALKVQDILEHPHHPEFKADCSDVPRRPHTRLL